MPAVAGTFYPADPRRLGDLVDDLLAAATGVAPFEGPLAGLLVPHAGLVYSGAVAATAWRLLAARGSAHGSAAEQGPAQGSPSGPGPATGPGPGPRTVVVLGTNHGAAWLDGVGIWPAGAWRTPLGDVDVDADLATAILGLGEPFVVDREAHVGEHSIEVQLPIVRVVAPDLRIVPLAVSTGIGPEAIAAGERLGALLIGGRAAGARVILAISSDMAHYPAATACDEVTRRLLPAILGRDAPELARLEPAVRRAGIPGLVCGMCGIEPTVLGLAALAAAGVGPGVALASATSADGGGPADRTVGYLAVAFPW
jgi:AmmeMemoRadiSam system protein B